MEMAADRMSDARAEANGLALRSSANLLPAQISGRTIERELKARPLRAEAASNGRRRGLADAWDGSWDEQLDIMDGRRCR